MLKVNHFLGIAAVISIFLWGCGRSSPGSTVVFVDRDETSANSLLPEGEDPLLLVVRITEDGKLALNKIDVGTIADLNPICEKLEAIFEDRARAGIDSKEVVIEMKGNISGENFEKLIQSLAAISARPIRVVKGNNQVGRSRGESPPPSHRILFIL